MAVGLQVKRVMIYSSLTGEMREISHRNKKKRHRWQIQQTDGNTTCERFLVITLQACCLIRGSWLVRIGGFIIINGRGIFCENITASMHMRCTIRFSQFKLLQEVNSTVYYCNSITTEGIESTQHCRKSLFFWLQEPVASETMTATTFKEQRT